MTMAANALPWTAEEDEQLQALLFRGASTAKISALLKRSESAVRGRASRLGLSVKHVQLRK